VAYATPDQRLRRRKLFNGGSQFRTGGFRFSGTAASPHRYIHKKGEYQDTVYLNTLETPAYQAAAEQLVNRINQSSPKTLGQESKPLVINFKY
jgi:hypothetical protein